LLEYLLEGKFSNKKRRKEIVRKELEYNPIFNVPPELQEKHELSMEDITDNPRHKRNVLTKVTARGPSDYETPKEVMEELLRQYLPILEKDPKTKRLDILAGGAVIRGLTNSPNVQRMEPYNWPEAPLRAEPQARFYLIIDVPDRKPHFWYCPETKTALSINSSYYGEKKSRSLGIGMDILQPIGIHSIHGSCIDIAGRGVVIIAPTGTGKSTLYTLLKNERGARILGDDWLYVQFFSDEKGRPRLAIGRYSELWLYMRTETAISQPSLAGIFEKSLLENVPIDKNGNYLWNAFENSRVLVDPLEMVSGSTVVEKENKLARFTSIEKVVFLRRDSQFPELVKLDPEEAVKILSEGKMQYLPGSGKTGAGIEPWLNPYVLVNKENLVQGKSERALLNIDFQNYYFALLFAVTGGAYYLNTANRTPLESLKSLREIISEPSELALDFNCHAYRTERISETLEKQEKDNLKEFIQTIQRFRWPSLRKLVESRP